MIPSETKRLLNFRTRTQAHQRMLYKTNRKTRLRKECALSSQGGKVCLCDSNFLIAGNTNLLIIFRLREVLIYGKLAPFFVILFFDDRMCEALYFLRGKWDRYFFIFPEDGDHKP